MKAWYNAVRLLVAIAVIFCSGYLFAKPRDEADKVFAPVYLVIGVYGVWRSGRPGNPFAGD